MGESVGKYPTPARIVLSVRSPSKTGHSHRSRRKTATRTQRKSEHSGVVRSPEADCGYSPEPSGKYSPTDWKLCFTVGFGSGTAYRRRGKVPGLEGEGTRSEATRAASAFWTLGRISSSTTSDRKARRAATGQAGVERQLQGQWGRPNRHVVYLRQVDAHPWQSQTATHAFCSATALGA